MALTYTCFVVVFPRLTSVAGAYPVELAFSHYFHTYACLPKSIPFQRELDAFRICIPFKMLHFYPMGLLSLCIFSELLFSSSLNF